MSRQSWWQRRHTRRNSTAYPPRILLTITQKALCTQTVLSGLHFHVEGIQDDTFNGFNLPITPHHSVSSIDDGNILFWLLIMAPLCIHNTVIHTMSYAAAAQCSQVTVDSPTEPLAGINHSIMHLAQIIQIFSTL